MAQNHQRLSRRAVSSVGWGWMLAFSVTAALGIPAQAPAEDPDRIEENRIVGNAVFEVLEREARARVVIAFELAPARGGRAITDLTSPEGEAAVVAAADTILQSIRPEEFLLQHRFESIRVLGGEITADGLLDLLDAPGVVRVDLAVGGSNHLAQAVPLVNLNLLRAQGFTGTGVTVAVLDSGYDSNHADLSDDLVGEACFCGGGCCPNGSSSQTGAGSAEDDHGHGSHVAGIITSSGLQAPKGGAPDAGVVAVKVVDDAGHFQSSLDVAAALDWVRNWTAARVVNLSLGTDTLYAGACDNADAGTMAFRDAINNLHNNGVAVFAASGNNGSGTQMTAPACIANAISVGAVYDANVGSQTTGCTDPSTTADQVTCFSNSNSTTDVFAPGAPTRSVKMGGGAVNKSGTSMASPLAAACAAAVLEAVPGLTPGEIRAAVKTSPEWVTDATNGRSFPRLDCKAALDCVTVLAPLQISPQGTIFGDPGPLTWWAVPGAIEYDILVDSIIPAEPAILYTKTAAAVGCASGTGICTFDLGGAPSGCGGAADWGIQYEWWVRATTNCRTGAANETWMVTVPPTHALTVSKSGTGTGLVTSSAGGLDCGTDCQECYYEGMSIELLATPDMGSEFAGWSGDADCSDGELAMSSDTACTAAFDPCSLDPTVNLPEPLETINEETNFEACNILSTGSDNSDDPSVFTLGPLADVTFRAGNLIVIKNGFWLEMEAGAKFRAVVGPP